MTARLRLRQNVRDYVLLAPGAIWVAVFLIAPLLLLIIFSFYTHVPGGGFEPIFTTENWIRLFTVQIYSAILLITIQIALLVTALTFLIGYPVAYMMVMKIRNATTRFLLLLLFLIPFWIDWSIRSKAWYPILGEGGPIVTAINSAGIAVPGSLIFSSSSVILVMVQSYMLFMIAPIFLSLSRIDPLYLDAAKTLGASRWRSFYEITFRMSLPGVVIGAIFVVVFSMADYATPRLMGSVVQTVGYGIVSQVGILNWPLAAAYSTLAIVATVGLIYVLMRVVDIKRMIF